MSGSAVDGEQKPPARKRGLGRGLDALLGATRAPVLAVPMPGADALAPGADEPDAGGVGEGAGAPGERVRRLPLEQIRPGRYQARRDFDADALRELADSILAQGVIQPIVVRPLGADSYELIAGERRWRACQQAGLASIPALVREVAEPVALALGLIENIQRADLNPLEEATALSRLLNEFQLTHQQVAEAVGKSRATVSNLLRLLDLEPEVRERLARDELDMGHARALLGLSGAAQTQAARDVAARGLSVRETERLVRRLQQDGETPPRPAPTPDPNIRRLQLDLTERLGARVEIRQGQRGAGKLVIAYNSLDELDGILAHLQ